jgi:hypothetical protein
LIGCIDAKFLKSEAESVLRRSWLLVHLIPYVDVLDSELDIVKYLYAHHVKEALLFRRLATD